jgi:UDPglucose 6-dehydrogenase
VQDPYELASSADALVVCTEWNEFKQLDLEQIKSAMNRPVIIDGRNIYDPVELAGFGFKYHGMGRGIGPEDRGELAEEAS